MKSLWGFALTLSLLVITGCQQPVGTDTSASDVATVRNALAITFSETETAVAVTKNVGLPNLGANGVVITWQSSSPEVVSTSGVVTRPLVGKQDAIVTLIATIRKNSVSDTKSFSLVVKAIPDTSSADVAETKVALQLAFATGDSASSVTGNLGLPNGDANGVVIRWDSSNPALISGAGVVTRPAAGQPDAPVTLTATLTKAPSGNDTKIFPLTVKAAVAVDTSAADVAATKMALVITYLPGDSASSVTGNLTLPSNGANGVSITWSSGNPILVTNSGLVSRPTSGSAGVPVTLTATLSKNGVTETRSFVIYVMPMPDTSVADVAAAKEALLVTYAVGDSATSVTSDLSLPTVGANGVAVSWTTSNDMFISFTGKVTRPAAGLTDATVTLTANLSKLPSAAAATKVFVLTVKANPVVDTSLSDVANAKASLAVGYGGLDSASSVTESLALYPSAANGVSVSWWSSNASAVAANGVVNRPAAGQPDATVTLIATLTKNSVSDTKTFVLTVRALPLSTNADLASLGLNEATISPAFSSGTTTYTADVANGISSVTVNAVAASASARITSGTGLKPLVEGVENLLQVVVTAQNGATKTYSITVTRAPALSSNADLSSLALNEATLAPAFSADHTNYTASVSNGVGSVTVNATAYSASAIISSGTGTKAISVGSGNVLNVVVTAQNGSTKTYTITVTRAGALSSNASLSALSLTEATLSPAFSADQLNYTANVPNAVSVIHVYATKADGHSTITSAVDFTGAAGTPVSAGINVLRFLVTAQDGTTKNYTITVTRLGSGGLSDITVEDPVFVTVTFTATPPTKTSLGTNFTITASPSTTVDSYSWYQDGILVSGESLDTITTGASLPVGVHNLTCVVMKSDTLFSNGFTFLVQ